ncbi:hypothetical protein M885DRAFT_50401 [Pelagophyceae sp. CCMP2097]|nr:hypothetical protein M885DRAFT_50401 [Pelagophyceae sp. CCMP2097]
MPVCDRTVPYQVEMEEVCSWTPASQFGDVVVQLKHQRFTEEMRPPDDADVYKQRNDGIHVGRPLALAVVKPESLRPARHALHPSLWARRPRFRRLWQQRPHGRQPAADLEKASKGPFFRRFRRLPISARPGRRKGRLVDGGDRAQLLPAAGDVARRTALGRVGGEGEADFDLKRCICVLPFHRLFPSCLLAGNASRCPAGNAEHRQLFRRTTANPGGPSLFAPAGLPVFSGYFWVFSG